MSHEFGVDADHRFGLIPRAVAFGNVSVTAKAVYAVLAQYAGSTNLAWPSHKTLAERLGVSVSTIQRAIKQLSEAGFLTIEHRYAENGSQRSSVYHLGSMTYSPPENMGGHQRPGGVVTDDQGGWSPVTGGGSHERPGGVVTDDRGPRSPVTDRRRTSEVEPLKKGPRRNYEDALDLAAKYERESMMQMGEIES